MKIVTRMLLSFICILLSDMVCAQPPRKAWMGANGSFSEKGLAVDTVMPNGTLYSLGLRKGDTLRKLNGVQISEAVSFNNMVSGTRTGEAVSILYKRGSKEISKTGKAIVRPYDTLANTDVIYGWVDHGDCKLRTIVRRPKGQDKIPAVLLIPGYNCGSVENYNQGIYSKLIASWLENGFAVVTVEKSGLGDSYNCQPCAEADLVTDLQTFDAGYKYMENLPFVDKDNLFIWGHSMGGVIAPEIGKLHRPKGIIVFATVFRPWSEFLLEMHRVQWPLDGKSYTETEKEIRLIQKIYYEFFVEKKSPAELFQNPEYKEMVSRELEYRAGATNMWGRHWRFWQQIDSLDMAASWSAVQCPVLSIFGGADFIACSPLEHDLITRTVNATHPGNCTHITIPDIDHLITVQKDWKEANTNFSNLDYRSSHFHYGFTEIVNNWMRKQVINPVKQ